jgi:hypothetical protein
MNQVVILRSLPGGGKTSLIPFIEKEYGVPAFICSADHFHYFGKEHTPENYNFSLENLSIAHKTCKNKFLEALNYNEPLVIVDNTNIKFDEYNWYFQEAIRKNYNVIFYTIKCSVEESFNSNVHKVPLEVIQRMKETFLDTPKEIDGVSVDEKVYSFQELRK